MGTREALVSQQFLCPVSSEFMRDPVILASGKIMFPPLRFRFLLPSLLRNLGNMCNLELHKGRIHGGVTLIGASETRRKMGHHRGQRRNTHKKALNFSSDD
ncbi:hypothetical protein QYE76_038730 [Lolium multiflorum]|uniref:U-box domain-containing protein n=1 Tax=Lolium multiflorum TaxID=4521 RepID=A0AAD8WR65_LOLMU|nr:hypothetical protein QYE76_038730 [Lolium multiflorum]